MDTKTVVKNTNIIYSVDIRNLSLRACNIVQDPVACGATSNYEDFFFDKGAESDNRKFDELPVIIDGIIYFRTKDEATTYIKELMGF